jgi:nicotinate-nucleotide pyrophosphorylase (carboxylating)
VININRLQNLIYAALDEDIGSGDVTTSAILDGSETGTAEAVAKEHIIVAGMDVFAAVFHSVDQYLTVNARRSDGEAIGKGEVLAEISGSLRSILTAERVALNFFQRMCGIATLTRKYVEKVKGTNAKILDTRKTVPCHRELDKYAVRMGGGFNHRMGLYGGAMIKDNHISAAGGIEKAVERTTNAIPPTLKIEVEAKNLNEVEEALSAGADMIMLDNMSIEEMRKAVILVNGRVFVEASGNVNLSTVRDIAKTGVDFISVGSLTHSVPAADISLNVVMG